MRSAWILTGGLLLAGCAAAPYGEEAQYAPEPPPPERAEISGPPETTGDAWVSGRWSREGNEWAWMPGRYVAPADRNLTWVPGRWAPYNNTAIWAYTPGEWKPLRESPPPDPLDLGPLAFATDGSPLLSIQEFLDLERSR
jgi:hypothetical protein